MGIIERIRTNGCETGQGEMAHKFVVDTINKEKLTLRPITDVTKKNTANLGFDKIEFTKIKERFDWETRRIAFYSTGCFGICQTMYLEIDSLGHLYFAGKEFTEKEGLYSGKLSTKEFDDIKSYVNSIVLDSLKNRYSSNRPGITEPQTCGVRIRTADTTYQSSAYGFDREPIELRMLFEKLMGLYKTVELKKDSTIIEKFEYKGSHYHKESHTSFPYPKGVPIQGRQP